MGSHKNQVTVTSLQRMKQRGERITMLTAYDYTMAVLLDRAGIDVLLVGDSLGMVIQGHATTVPVNVREMIYHGKLVARGAEHAMVVVDLPFPHGQLGVRKTLEVSAKIMKQTGCQAIKLEGGAEQAKTIKALVAAGIPVIAHVGLRPQSVHAVGGYRVQRDAGKVLADAVAAERAGAFCVLMECVPRGVAANVTEQLKIPTIGIGAGPACDGQVLVTHDLVGLTTGHVPKFVRPMGELSRHLEQALSSYREAVRSGGFPGADETFE